MTNLAKAALEPVYSRLAGVEPYHPFSADTFSDWSVEAGDIVTFSKGDREYKTPVHATNLLWRGQPEMTFDSGGNKERSPISKLSQDEYNDSSSGLDTARETGRTSSRTRKLSYDFYDPSGKMAHFEVNVDHLMYDVYDPSGKMSLFEVDINGMKHEVYDENGRVSILQNTAEGLRHEVYDPDGKFAVLTSTVEGITATVGELDEDMQTIHGSALWTKRDNITGVSGKFDVDESGNLHIIDGSQLYMDKNGASLAVYNEGTLTAGVIVDKVNNGTARITGAHVAIGSDDATSVVTGLKNTTQTITDSALWVNRENINAVSGCFTRDASGNVHVKNGSKFYMGEGGSSLEVYTDSNLTAGVLVRKINGGTAQITGDHVIIGSDSVQQLITGLRTDVNGAKSDIQTVTDSALWVNRDNINAVSGELYRDANGNIHVRNGSQLYMDKNGGSFAVYDNNNLTAGVIVDKINGGTTTIAGSKIDIGGAVLINKINESSSDVTINASRINLNGVVTADRVKAALANATSVTVKSLTVQASGIYVNGTSAKWTALTAVTAVNFTTQTTTRRSIHFLGYLGGSGGGEPE